MTQEQIKQKAKRYSQNGEYRYLASIKEMAEVSFIEGANFILDQLRWRNVEDELPETNDKDEFGIKVSKYVIVKTSNKNYPYIATYYLRASDDEFFDTDLVKNSEITHWKPIEL